MLGVCSRIDWLDEIDDWPSDRARGPEVHIGFGAVRCTVGVALKLDDQDFFPVPGPREPATSSYVQRLRSQIKAWS